MNWLYISAGIIFGILILLFALAYIIFYETSVRKKPRKNDLHVLFTQNKIDIVGEEHLKEAFNWVNEKRTDSVCIESDDGLRLHATLINIPKDKKANGVVIIFHGYRSFGARDFCLQLPMLYEAGYNIMLVDHRAHANSEGKYICYGTKECYDAILWRKKATEIYGDELPIAFFGLSMGGATVLMASGLVEKDDPQVKCVIADCPFDSSYEIIKHVLWKYRKIYPHPSIHFANFWTRFIASFNMHSPTASERVKESHLPILLFHGKEDKFVPTQCSIDIANAAGDRAKLVLVDKAQHAEAIYYNPELYKKELIGFLETHMI